MCMKSEGKGLDAECDIDSECRNCPVGKHKNVSTINVGVTMDRHLRMILFLV